MISTYRCCCSLLAILSAFVAFSCSSSVYKEVYPALNDGQYDSEFPYRGCSKQLEQISETVKRVSCIAYYKVYSFQAADRVRLSDLTDSLLQAREKESVFTNSSTSGTATVIFAQGRKVALLTCAHIVAFPDTQVTYHVDADHKLTGYVAAFALKKRQSTFVAMLPEGGDVDILAIDKNTDVALLGATFETAPSIPLQVFPFPLGRAKELEWGSFIYLFGYPAGYAMVTKGIVSSPNKDKKGTFLLDAVFSRGFSGGICLAIRDGVPNFELVGMVKLVAARTSYVITPGKEYGSADFDSGEPYGGSIYVERKTEIEYGITQAIPIEVIRDFLEDHREALGQKGFTLDSFLNSRSQGS